MTRKVEGICESDVSQLVQIDTGIHGVLKENAATEPQEEEMHEEERVALEESMCVRHSYTCRHAHLGALLLGIQTCHACLMQMGRGNLARNRARSCLHSLGALSFAAECASPGSAMKVGSLKSSPINLCCQVACICRSGVAHLHHCLFSDRERIQ